MGDAGWARGGIPTCGPPCSRLTFSLLGSAVFLAHLYPHSPYRIAQHSSKAPGTVRTQTTGQSVMRGTIPAPSRENYWLNCQRRNLASNCRKQEGKGRAIGEVCLHAPSLSPPSIESRQVPHRSQSWLQELQGCIQCLWPPSLANLLQSPRTSLPDFWVAIARVLCWSHSCSWAYYRHRCWSPSWDKAGSQQCRSPVSQGLIQTTQQGEHVCTGNRFSTRGKAGMALCWLNPIST